MNEGNLVKNAHWEVGHGTGTGRGLYYKWTHVKGLSTMIGVKAAENDKQYIVIATIKSGNWCLEWSNKPMPRATVCHAFMLLNEVYKEIDRRLQADATEK